MNVKVLALDLERTVIDDALSACPRPGLLDFLAFCHERFERVTLFTTVEEADAREVLWELSRRGHVPIAGWCGGPDDELSRVRFALERLLVNGGAEPNPPGSP